MLDATVRDGRGNTPLGDLEIAAGSPAPNGDALAVILPDQIQVHVDDHTGVVGHVIRAEYFGYGARVEIAMHDGEKEFRLTARVPADDVPAEGSAVAVAITGPVWFLPRDGELRDG